MPIKKRSWATAKPQMLKSSVRVVGTCIYCAKQVENDMRFVVFATKEPAHFECYTKDENKKQINSAL